MSTVTTRQFVILSLDPANGASLGRRAEIYEKLARLNTMPEREGEDVVHGPGINIQFPPGDDPEQLLLTIVEEEIAWQVMPRVLKELGWKLLDPTTGRELGAAE